eukprot:PhM_4_TR18737/c7_g1_i1/m.65860
MGSSCCSAHMSSDDSVDETFTSHRGGSYPPCRVSVSVSVVPHPSDEVCEDANQPSGNCSSALSPREQISTLFRQKGDFSDDESVDDGDVPPKTTSQDTNATTQTKSDEVGEQHTSSVCCQPVVAYPTVDVCAGSDESVDPDLKNDSIIIVDDNGETNFDIVYDDVSPTSRDHVVITKSPNSATSTSPRSVQVTMPECIQQCWSLGWVDDWQADLTGTNSSGNLESASSLDAFSTHISIPTPSHRRRSILRVVESSDEGNNKNNQAISKLRKKSVAFALEQSNRSVADDDVDAELSELLQEIQQIEDDRELPPTDDNMVSTSAAPTPRHKRRRSTIRARCSVVNIDHAGRTVSISISHVDRGPVIGDTMSCCSSFSQAYPMTPSRRSSAAVLVTTLIRDNDDEGRKLVNEYAVLGELGRGAYGKVKLAINIHTDAPIALKILNRQRLKKARVDLKNEISVMEKLRHPNIVRLHSVINDPTADKVYLVLEYVSGGSFVDQMNEGYTIVSTNDDGTSLVPMKLTTDSFRTRFLDVLHGLQYLHNHNVVHMDIKPENILVGED